MNNRRWLGTLAVLSLAVAACSSRHGTAPGPGTSSAARLQSSCPAARPAPQFAASAPSNRSLVLGKLSGSDRTVVRDITDVTHPRTLTTGDIPSIRPRFVSATDVSYVDQGGALI